MEEEVHVPVDRVDDYVEEVLDVVISLTRPKIEAFQTIDPEGERVNLERTRLLVLSHGDHVFVKQLGDVKILLELLTVLAQRTTER